MKFVGGAGFTLLQTKEDQLETSTMEAFCSLYCSKKIIVVGEESSGKSSTKGKP
jgi:GTPase SAR1 family protein